MLRRVENAGYRIWEGRTSLPAPSSPNDRTYFNWRAYKTSIDDARYFDMKFDCKENLTLTLKPNLLFEGQNVDLAPLNKVKEFFINLSHYTGVNLLDAEISELDYTYNVETKYRPWQYFDVMGEASLGKLKFERQPIKTTLYYENASGIKLKFYDKGKDAYRLKKHWKGKCRIPEKHINANLLRYELKLWKVDALRRAFKIGSYGVDEETRAMNLAKVHMLFNKVFVNNLVELWIQCFDCISLQIDNKMNDNQKFKLADTRNELMVQLSSKIGVDEVFKILDNLVLNDVTSSRDRSIIKKQIKEHTQNRKLHPLANELTYKIKEFKPIWEEAE